jgi:hypothetical protein
MWTIDPRGTNPLHSAPSKGPPAGGQRVRLRGGKGTAIWGGFISFAVVCVLIAYFWKELLTIMLVIAAMSLAFGLLGVLLFGEKSR